MFVARACQKICPTALPTSSRRPGLQGEREIIWRNMVLFFVTRGYGLHLGNPILLPAGIFKYVWNTTKVLDLGTNYIVIFYQFITAK